MRISSFNRGIFKIRTEHQSYVAFLFSIAVFVLLIVLFQKPRWLFLLVGLIVSIDCVFIYFILKIIYARADSTQFGLLKKNSSRLFFIRGKYIIVFLLSLVLFHISGMLFSIFVSSGLRYMIAIVEAFFTFIYLKTLFLYIERIERSMSHPLADITCYINIIGSYFFFGSVFALVIFLNIKLWILTLLIMFLIFLQGYLFLKIYQVELKRIFFILLVMILILLEIFWSLNFLPISFYVSAFVLAVSYYVFFSLVTLKVLKALKPNVCWRYLVFGISLVVLCLASARWV